MEAPPNRRSSGMVALLAALALGGSGAGVLVYQSLQGKQAVADTSGFDLADVEDTRRGGAAAPADRGQSGLGMITGALPGMQTGQKAAPQNPSPAPSAGFAELVRGSEAKIKALAERYSRRFPVVQQYGRDWMKYPDLKKLNDDYMKNRDPIAFMKGVAASPNFGKLMKRYASEKPIQDFVKEGIQAAPPGAVGAAMEYLNSDKNLKGLVDNVAANLGIPASLMSIGSGEPAKIDEKKVMQQVLGSNPELQRQLQNQPGFPSQ